MMSFSHNFSISEVFNPRNITNVIDIAFADVNTVKSSKKISYYNASCAFDIETSSFYMNSEKTAIMYEWTLGLNGLVIVGRTWEQFCNVIKVLIERLQLNINKRLIIYVHNLAYEFQFLSTHFRWENVFCVDNRKPVYAVTTSGIEFRCSYILSGYSLAKVGDELKVYTVRKMVGDLDYSLIRHSKTPLTDMEVTYCVNDVKVVMAYIQEQLELEGNITNIPLTNTSYVRRYMRKLCLKGHYGVKYRELILRLTLTSDEYKQLKRAFQGGFTHANPNYVNRVIDNVSSYDFTSSYPTVMISEKFPMSKGMRYNIKDDEDFKYNLNNYCCIFDVELIDIYSKIYFDSYISISKCYVREGVVLNNGRVVSAKRVCLTITEQDFFIISKFYGWEHCRIRNFVRYKKAYLPTPIVEGILKLYSDKTVLKGVAGKEIEYQRSKSMLNSCYGMIVTDIVKPINTYTTHWECKPVDYDEEILKYNHNKQRFLYYPWGVWVTAYARRNLFTGIMEFRDDYIYSDTDSVKVINIDKHKSYIDKYNRWIYDRLCTALDYHELDRSLIEPKTIEGKVKRLGIWDFEGSYTKFKTLGAKRYMVEKDDKINITVSGLNKKICVPYLIEDAKKNNMIPFDIFTNGLYVPCEYTGKNVHTYIDEMREGIVYDYLGEANKYKELSSVHLEEADYSLSMSHDFIDYITDLRGVSC